MSFNVPTVTESDFSIGPGIIRFGAVGSTPATDVGTYSEDGITTTFEAEFNVLRVGNTATEVHRFAQVHGFMLSFNSVEWDLTRLANAIGSGVTTVSGSEETLSWGGDPTVKAFSVQVEHAMAAAAHTMFYDVWKMVAEGGQEIVLGSGDRHTFPTVYRAQRVDVNWASVALAKTSTLLRMRRQLT